MNVWVRYQIAKTGKRFQRVTWQVATGFLIVLASHFWPNGSERSEKERDWLRDAGGGVMAFSLARWLSLQGQRRKDPATGSERRTPTLRMSPEEAQRIRRILRK